MKRKLLSVTVLIFTACMLHAQTVIYDNGPLVNLPGGGFNGADVSHIHDGMNSLGSNQSLANGYRLADDIVVPVGETWNIDSIVFYGYQTGSTMTSTFTDVNVRIWNGVPDDVGSVVVSGDDITNVMVTSEWTGAYRTADFGSPNCEPSTCTSRPIMRNATVSLASLTAGTYWIDWQSNGTLASGPWAPQINLGVGVTTSGNALQYVPANAAWQAVEDTVPANAGNPPYEPQGFPFLVIGSIVTGVHSPASAGGVSVFPNPVTDKANVTITLPMQSGTSYTFELFDMLGNSVARIDAIHSNKFELNRGSLADGIYFYELRNSGSTLKQGKVVFE